MNPTISVVTGTWNRLSLLKEMIASTRAQFPVGMSYEIIVADGGSTDGSLEWLREQRDIVLLEQGKLIGAVKAFTEAAKVARGQYVVMANDDIEFWDGAILKAIIYINEHQNCGQVAFEDNRLWGNERYDVQYMPAFAPDGRSTSALYGQVSLCPRWLGDAVGWWGGDDPTFPSRTYGADNYLSSRIWEMGYTVNRVEGARIRDFMPSDELRAINTEKKSRDNDADAWLKRFNGGPRIVTEPLIAAPSGYERKLRILYLPIYERDHKAQHEQKRGLRDALAKYFWVAEYDYFAASDPATMRSQLIALIQTFEPDMVLSQLHGPDMITERMLLELRSLCPRMVWANWNGDYWPAGLTSQGMIDLLRYVDLQLVVNGSVLKDYEARGIPAAYWQIGYEEPGDELPDEPAYDILFQGGGYSEKRLELGKWLHFVAKADALGTVGLVGYNWGDLGTGIDTLYDFAAGKALINHARVVIGDNQYPDAYGFFSNRVLQTLAAGGGLLLHQHVPGMEELTGLIDGIHFIGWRDLEDLRVKLNYWLNPENEKKRRKVARAGMIFVREAHSFDARLRELFAPDGLLRLARRRVASLTTLEFIGLRPRNFGLVGLVSGDHYEFTPGKPLRVDPRDAPHFLKSGEWKEVDFAGDAISRAAEITP
jgi:glycosyltransferase involved in cell wall biosynthesis